MLVLYGGFTASISGIMAACGVTNCFIIDEGFVGAGVARGLCLMGWGVNGRHKKAQPVQTRVGLFDGLR